MTLDQLSDRLEEMQKERDVWRGDTLAKLEALKSEAVDPASSSDSEEEGGAPSLLNGALGAVLFLSGMVLGMWMIDSSSSDNLEGAVVNLEKCLELVGR